jgi:hypothetical protein
MRIFNEAVTIVGVTASSETENYYERWENNGLKGSVVTYLKDLSHRSPGDSEGKNCSFRVASKRAEIRTEFISKRNCYASDFNTRKPQLQRVCTM